ncbi:related to neutral amino acid permease [Melanopsichium pennsylvanicum]|uniref:Related to neutral amino acid permease n=2 Tax=Melanopsichium pennsylvanicum TaxID=63383 RepID=A0AAJ4XGK8_9BASI|nr:related to neutral amino acid permease [Melanopsichium pennsylvanicum 4]SNX82134.1 related to neutral amino acid permease [Melanopsichium pennsylvanicum]
MATSHTETPARMSSDTITTTIVVARPNNRSESPSPERKAKSSRPVGSSFLFPSGERAKSWQDSYLFELLGERGAQMYETTEKGQNVQVSDIEEANKVEQEQQRAHDHAAIPKTLGWLGGYFNMVAYAIALGILSIPLVAVSIGVVPFVMLTFLFAFICYYTGDQYWKLKMRFPGVQNLQDAGFLMFGPWGARFLGAAQLIFSIFLQGNHVLLGGQAFHILGWHSCAIVLAFVFAVISFFFTLPRSYKLFSISAFVSFSSIVTVVIFAMIASGITGPQNAPANAPPIKVVAFGPAPGVKVNFLTGFLYVLNLFISFGAIPSYLPIISEMRKPGDFRKSLSVLVAVQLVLYLLVGGVIYHNLGQYTTSPSLSSLSHTTSRIAYGLALPTILIAGCESGQVANKHLYIIVFRSRPQHIHNSTKLGWLVWTLINAVTWVLAFILAQLIPFFSSFLGLEAALFWSLFTGLSAVMWLYLNQGRWIESRRKIVGLIIALMIIVISAVICVAGIWASAISIRDSYNAGQVGSPFSCASVS